MLCSYVYDPVLTGNKEADIDISGPKMNTDIPNVNFKAPP
jgi:hypothetical protein